MAASNEYSDQQSPKSQTFGYGVGATASDKFSALAGEHWYEMTATLCPESTAVLSDWIDEDLAVLEAKFSHFATPDSLHCSLQSRRSR